MHERETDRAIVQAAWRNLSQHYRWSLLDEATLIERALAECAALGQPVQQAVRVAIWRVYSAELYERLNQRNDVAAQELWRMFLYMALRRRISPLVAEELAQEAVLRVLIKLPGLRSPQALLTWSLRLFGTVQRELTNTPAEAPLEEQAERDQAQASSDDVAADVEGRLMSADLRAQWEALLPNPFERTVLERSFYRGDKPRDIARDLNLPSSRIRVAKARALARLREDPTILDRLRDFVGGTAPAEGNTGIDDDDR